MLRKATQMRCLGEELLASRCGVPVNELRQVGDPSGDLYPLPGRGPSLSGNFPPKLRLAEGGGAPLSRYEKMQKRFIRNCEKNDNDINLKVG